MGGKAEAPPPPDYSGIAAASKEAAEIQAAVAREQLAWAKEQYASDRTISDKVVNFALDMQADNKATAEADRARYESIWQPVEDKLRDSVMQNADAYSAMERRAISDANSYDSPERQAMEAGRAQANVAQQFDSQRNAALQNLESFGIDPSSTRYAALDASMRANQGAAMAAEGNTAIARTEATGRQMRDSVLGRGQAMRSEAINVGRGYPGSIAQQYGTALQSGNQAVNSQLATTASGANTMGTGAQYYGLSNQSLGTWGNALTQGYNAQLAQFQANNSASSGWGSALGMGAGLLGAMFFEDGGAVRPEYAEGGAIRFEDSVPAMRVSDNIEDRRRKTQLWQRRGSQWSDPDNPYPPTGDFRSSPSVRNNERAYAAGGAIDTGDVVPPQASPTGGAAVDDVTARLNVGEFVIPEETVNWYGEKHFQQLIDKANKERQKATAKPEYGPATPQEPTFASRGALPVG